MGSNYNPKIVTDGLVLCLDAANNKSYPASGNNWSNLVGSEILTKSGSNSISFLNYFFRFPDVSDTAPDNNNRFAISKSNLLQGSDGTFMAWARVLYTGNKSNRYIAASSDNLNRMYLRIEINNNVNSVNIVRGDPSTTATIGTVPINTWYCSGLTWYNSNTMQGILNNQLLPTTYAFTNTASFNAYLTIGQQDGVGRVYPGDIACFYYYNRALTASEVLQNYNALKGRFGL